MRWVVRPAWMFWLGRNNKGIWGGVCEFSGLFTAGVVGFAPIHLELNTSQGLEEKSMEAREREGTKARSPALQAVLVKWVAKGYGTRDLPVFVFAGESFRDTRERHRFWIDTRPSSSGCSSCRTLHALPKRTEEKQ